MSCAKALSATPLALPKALLRHSQVPAYPRHAPDAFPLGCPLPLPWTGAHPSQPTLALHALLRSGAKGKGMPLLHH
jgi:hypothetical protein